MNKKTKTRIAAKRKIKANAKVKQTEVGMFKEKVIIFVSLSLFVVGAGLIVDGRKLYSQQLKNSLRISYKAPLITNNQN